jgi:hypothetical protein
MEDILAYISGQREFRWGKDTWYSSHCLNAVHEEAGNEYVHGKLKEDKLRR